MEVASRLIPGLKEVGALDYRPSLLFVCGIVIGLAGWSSMPCFLAFTPFVIALWAAARARAVAGLVMFGYYLAASRGMLSGVEAFFVDADGAAPSILLAPALWLTCGLLVAATWAMCWGRRYVPVRALLALVLVSVPPIGIVGWANPLTAAGQLFPGAGWLGFAMLLLLCLMLAGPRSRRASCYLLLIAAAIGSVPRANNENVPLWQGVDTTLGPARAPEGALQRLRDVQVHLMARAQKMSRGSVLLLPELIAGDWEANAPWWKVVDQALMREGKTALVGAAVQGDGERSINVLVAIGAHRGVRMVDRMPVPGSMWRPWSTGGFTAFMGGPGVTQLGTQRVGHLICYEQLLMWPPLVTMAGRPDVVVAPSNGWWARGTSIGAVQHTVVRAWARLFDVRLVEAVNT